jgi:hypothetical protein
MALERVLGVFGVVVRFDESDPHGPSTIGADRTCSGFRRIKSVSHSVLLSHRLQEGAQGLRQIRTFIGMKEEKNSHLVVPGMAIR